MFNLEKKFVLERLSLERRRNGYCETMMGLSMGISDEIEVATIVIDETIKSGNRECSLPADVLWGSFVTHSFRTVSTGIHRENIMNTSEAECHLSFREQFCWHSGSSRSHLDFVFSFLAFSEYR